MPVSRFHTILVVAAGMSVALLSSPLLAAKRANFTVTRNVFYGKDRNGDQDLQSLDIYWQKDQHNQPVIIYVHGGGWAFGDKSNVHHMPGFFAGHHISFISMNYRLRWRYKLYDQLEDVVSVVHWVRLHHAHYGLDPDKIVLMGNGAGAFLVSLVGTDEGLLKTQGMNLGDIRSVVAVNNPSFDIPALMRNSGNFIEKRRYRLVFGSDEAVWSTMSPINHVGAGKHIPPFAIVYVTSDESEVDQAKNFAKTLRDAKVNVIMIPDNKRASESVTEELGTPGDGPSLALMAFIGAAL